MLIEIKDARKEYGYGDSLVKALDGVNLSLEEGKIEIFNNKSDELVKRSYEILNS